MWFRFPDGTDNISVQQQNYRVEAEDSDGRGYFRAPEHFAPIILDLPGFVTAQPPAGAPEDLPRTLDNQASQTVDRLGGQLAAKDLEIGHLKSSMAEVSVERDNLKLAVNKLEGRVADLEEELATAKEPKLLPTAPATAGAPVRR